MWLQIPLTVSKRTHCSAGCGWAALGKPSAFLLQPPLTCLSASDGYFIYLDGSRAEEGDVAHLVSPTCSSHKPQCFRFWYHMYGVARTMSLRVYVASGSAAPELIWSASGNQGNRWWKAEVSVAHQGSVQVREPGLGGRSSGLASSQRNSSDRENSSLGLDHPGRRAGRGLPQRRGCGRHLRSGRILLR